jgi:3-hydroxyacyl-[acyl-carrier-protein] dehydratase
MPPGALFDLSQVDFGRVVADRDEIRRYNPQRFDMEQLTAVVHLDPGQHLIVGYKDVSADEFWVRGHMPGYPLLPGVLMCEAAAQLCSYYCLKAHLLQGDFIGFGGLENVQFRGPVRPGDRLVLVAKGQKLHRRKTVFNVQGFVGGVMVFNGDIIGVPMSKQSAAAGAEAGEA